MGFRLYLFFRVRYNNISLYERSGLLEPTGCILIVNPTSGREKALRYIPLMESALKKRYLSVTLKMTEKAGDATAFASAASRLGQDIFCMGGDGTINETINGMVSAGSTATFGFVPLGTVNDLARACIFRFLRSSHPHAS